MFRNSVFQSRISSRQFGYGERLRNMASFRREKNRSLPGVEPLDASARVYEPINVSKTDSKGFPKQNKNEKTPKTQTSKNDLIQGVTKMDVKKSKDPDEEFMRLWTSTENHRKFLLSEKVLGKSRRKYKIAKRVEITNLPGQSELTRDEQRRLLEDEDSIKYFVPKVGDIVQNLEYQLKFAQRSATQGEQDSSNTEELSFEDIGVHPKLIERLHKRGIFKPVLIQQKALPLIYKNENVLIKSETGSGKTFVFLLPTVQDPGKGFGSVIIVPTRELASQMLFETNRLLGDQSIVSSFVSGVDSGVQERRLENVDNYPRIVIGTPKRLLELINTNPALFLKTKRVVVDEVDKIFSPLHRRAPRKKIISRSIHPRPGRSFIEALAEVSKVQRKQFIGASATIDANLVEELSGTGLGDHVRIVEGPGYGGRKRAIPSSIQHCYTVYREKNDLSKANALARAFLNSKQTSALVFIHRNLSVDDFVWELKYLGVDAVALYKIMAYQNAANHEAFLSDFRSGKHQLVVGTEETVRGLDFQDLEHVYLMEVPKNVEEYVHLAGRVGRQGKPGTVTTVVSGDVEREEKRMVIWYRRLGVSYQQVQ